jgi:hypothetical protein
MADNLQKKSCLVYDHGYFVEVAFRLARDFGTVYYCTPWEKAQSKVDDASIGDGFGEIIRVSEPWGLIDQDKIDLAMFPDVHHPEMQEHVARLGIPTWGARHADKLEIGKLFWKKLQEEFGMDFSEYDVVEGIDELREFCKREIDRWVKLTPQYRGNQETFYHKDYASSRATIDLLAVEFGLLQDVVKFVVEKSIKSRIEGGIDTYTVDGEHPEVAVYGFEKKDKCYLATVKPYKEIPQEITCVSDKLWPTLAEYGARQFISSEVKVDDDGKSYLLDNTLRMPSPAGEEQMELYDNFSEIIYHGACGVLLEPEVTHKFACEAMIEHNGDESHWRDLAVPAEARQWVKLYNCVQVKGRIGIKPMDHPIIGAVVGVGDTPKEAIAHLQSNAEMIKDQCVTIHTEALASIINEIEESESKGMPFAKEPLPGPETVLEQA